MLPPPPIGVPPPAIIIPPGPSAAGPPMIGFTLKLAPIPPPEPSAVLLTPLERGIPRTTPGCNPSSASPRPTASSARKTPPPGREGSRFQVMRWEREGRLLTTPGVGLRRVERRGERGGEGPWVCLAASKRRDMTSMVRRRMDMWSGWTVF